MLDSVPILKRRRRSLILIAALALVSAAPAQQPWLDDYAALKAAMEARYANLAWFGSPQGGVDLPRLDRRTTEALSRAETRDDALAALRAFVAAFDDGHFSIVPSPLEVGTPEAEPARPELGGSHAAQACAALGYGNRSQVAFSLPFESHSGFELMSERDASFRAGILRAGGTAVGLIRIRNFGPSQYPAECEAAWTAATVPQRADPDAFSDLVQRQWLRSLAATIDRVSTRHPAAMLVDIGTNSGGNESGDWSARLFTAQPLRSARVLMRPAAQAEAYFDDEIEAVEAAMRASADAGSRQAAETALGILRARKVAASSPACDLHWVWQERRDWAPFGCSGLTDAGFGSGAVAYQAVGAVRDPEVARRIYGPAIADPLIGRWHGPVFVLTNSATYSAAEMFAAVLQNNRAARIVGSPSGGDGCGFMVESEPLALPNLGLRIRLPNCVRLRSDGSNEVAGIRPDIPILSRDGESPRARAMRLLRAIAAVLPGFRG